ncbi:MAG: hypothetical protein GOVbin4206_120 [Prokaryotic dsDNA virus sp.]|nr:MAG: hypothetical protein GOVbin4206_120 [Prokaryotic dsDNA virus sp.]|tara:strand:+ start:511 stop:681 length:171 start_codon:yes stop_codon:yes gene_type:complete
MSMEEEIINLKNRIKGLEKDLDYQIEQNHNNTKMYNAIREMQDELSKKGFWFINRL